MVTSKMALSAGLSEQGSGQQASVQCGKGEREGGREGGREGER